MNRVRAILGVLLAMLLVMTGCSIRRAGVENPPFVRPTPTATVASPPSTPPPEASATPYAPTPKPVALPQDGPMELFFLNVGKGDAALIGLPGGHWVLVDAGPEDGIGELGRQLRRLGIERLDAIFLSHPHKDHRGGLKTVLDLVPTDVIYTGSANFVGTSASLQGIAEGAGVALKKLKTGQQITIGEAVFSIIGPVDNFLKENDNSMVVRLDCAGASALFVGDQLKEAEQALLQSGVDVNVDILKVGHHGRGDANSPEFLQAVSPQIAVIPNVANPDNGVVDVMWDRIGIVAKEVLLLGGTGTMQVTAGDGMLRSMAVGSDGEPPDVALIDINPRQDAITLQNRSGQTVSLAGWSIQSERGDEHYFFPLDYVLAAGQSVTVWSSRSDVPAGDLLWGEINVWHEKKRDRGLLFDPFGRIVSTIG